MRIILFLSIFVLTLVFVSSANASKFGYVGNKACEECHKEIYDSWKGASHTKVFELLAPGQRDKEKKEAALDPKIDYRKDKSCMKCHVTGFEEGGFTLEDKPDEWKGIGCEECHGGAEKWLDLHAKKNLKKRDRKLKQAGLIKPFKGKTVCYKCHTNVNSPYRYRDYSDRDWTSLEFAKSYHILP